MTVSGLVISALLTSSVLALPQAQPPLRYTAAAVHRVPVADVAAARDWYRDVLGFVDRGARGDDRVVALPPAGLELELFAAEAVTPGATLVLMVDDLARAKQRLAASDVDPVAGGTAAQPELRFADPWGNRIGMRASPDPEPEAADRIAALAWLTGTWRRSGPGALDEEIWSAPAVGSMVGLSRTVRSGALAMWEYMRIEQRGDGVVFVAAPKGRDETEFPMTESGAARVTFANDAHDFPNRITYWLEAPAVLRARVSGAGGRAFELTWQRVPQAPADTCPETWALSGRPLHAPPLPAATGASRRAALRQARRTWTADPADLDAAVWLGRRTAYLGRYREAVAIYSKALRTHPDEPQLLRHRGHRHITLRQLGRAVADLRRAAAQVEGQPDEVEPDGLPNARGVPTSTLQSNIFYHLGLALYLQGDFAGALDAYQRCQAVSRNPDMLCATTHWHYMTLRRLGRDDDAARLLEPITADLDVIENTGYHRLLLMYRGELTADQLLAEHAGAGGSIESATVAYGLANWHFYNGREDAARELWRAITSGSQWAAFGYIAAEADLWGR